MKASFIKYLVRCITCHRTTSKKFAREHGGQCKGCVTGEYSGPRCSQCDGPISAFKKARGYVCDTCTRENDPVGYVYEVSGRMLA